MFHLHDFYFPSVYMQQKDIVVLQEKITISFFVIPMATHRTFTDVVKSTSVWPYNHKKARSLFITIIRQYTQGHFSSTYNSFVLWRLLRFPSTNCTQTLLYPKLRYLDHNSSQETEPHQTYKNKFIGPEFLWPFMAVGVNVMFEEILALTRVSQIISSSRRSCAAKM